MAFLIAGPATNAATFTTLWKILGQRTAVLYLITVAFSAVVCGLLLDGLVAAPGAALSTLGSHIHEAAEGGWFYRVAAVVLLAVLAFSYWSGRKHDPDVEKANDGENHSDASSLERPMEFVIRGMTCSHCAESVRRALVACAGVRSVNVGLQDGRAVVTGADVDVDQLRETVAELGYSLKVCNTTESCVSCCTGKES